MERDRYGYVEFVEIQSVLVLFNEKPSFSELVARAREELHCHGADVSLSGCVYLLQLWMWARLLVGRPEVLARREWFPGQPPCR